MKTLASIHNNKAIYNDVQVTFIKTSDKLYTYYNLFNVRFDNIRVGDMFSFNGTSYTKKSSRTAFLNEISTRWFYFSNNDICDVYIHESK